MQAGDPQTRAFEQEEADWAAFVQQLGEHLAGQWPAMPERLGERYAAFVEHAVQQAEKRGLRRAAAVARYVNLCFVWGPAFQDKPGFEWAAGLLAAPREREWATTHQLLRRSLAELQRLPDTRIEPATLAAADERLLERFGALGRRGELHPYEPAPLPRAACDLEAVELRLLEAAVDQQYELQDGQWQRVPLPAPNPVRVTAADPAPRLIAVLSHPPSQRPQARLQLRSRAHTQCDGNVHPALNFAGTHGLWNWIGHETRAVSWPVATLEQAGPAAGPGTALGEETSPDIFKLELQVCGLRDEGDALGSMNTQLWVWPAAQWWLELERQVAPAQPVVAGQAPAARGTTRARVECDGQLEDSQPLRLGFERGLDRASETALQTWLAAFTRVEGLSAPRLEGQLGLLLGQASATWGWRLGPGGLDGRALLRLVGELKLQACQADLVFEGELALGGARARLVLRCNAAAALGAQLRREAAEPPLLAAMAGAQTSFRLPLTAELTPLASDSGALLMLAGPASGALSGVAGLRPRTSGGSGFEWFAMLRLEAAALPLLLTDPVLGQHSFSHALWPEQSLIDWRLA
jgi:hypothetical protein